MPAIYLLASTLVNASTYVQKNMYKMFIALLLEQQKFWQQSKWSRLGEQPKIKAKAKS